MPPLHIFGLSLFVISLRAVSVFYSVLKEVFNMKCSLFKNEDYKVSEWAGGFMKELAVFPRTSKYIDRDFIWRLSSDNVTKEDRKSVV